MHFFLLESCGPRKPAEITSRLMVEVKISVWPTTATTAKFLSSQNNLKYVELDEVPWVPAPMMSRFDACSIEFRLSPRTCALKLNLTQNGQNKCKII